MKNLTVLAYEPLAQGTRALGVVPFLTWSHEAAAFGGWTAAKCEIKCSQAVAADWLETGLGRRIVLKSDGEIMWEGFVNTVTVQMGKSVLKRGGLLDCANRVMVLFSWTPPESTTATQEDAGRQPTDLIDSEASKRLYGIVEKYISIGAIAADTLDDARKIADQAKEACLAAYAVPPLSLEINDDSQVGTVALELTGYVGWLQAYQHFDADNTRTSMLASEKVAAILAGETEIDRAPGDPNHFISTDLSLIQENVLLVNSMEDYNSAWAVMDDTVSRGGAGYGRWVAGVMQGRKFYYQPVPTTWSYLLRVKEAGLQMYTPSGREVPPWEVQPGRWCFMPDFMLRGPSGAPMAEDPRYLFIEHLEYTAPRGLTIQSGATSSTQQYLRSMGVVAN